MNKTLLIVLLILSTLCISSTAIAADGVPYNATIGTHIFTIDDPVQNVDGITFTATAHDTDDHPMLFQTILQRCQGSNCLTGTGFWTDVQYSEWFTSGDVTVQSTWACHTSKAPWYFRVGIQALRRNHTVTRITTNDPANFTKARCTA